MEQSNDRLPISSSRIDDPNSASFGQLRSTGTLNGPVLAALLASRSIDEITALFSISPKELSIYRERFGL